MQLLLPVEAKFQFGQLSSHNAPFAPQLLLVFPPKNTFTRKQNDVVTLAGLTILSFLEPLA